jgi:protein-disulfide isomerase
MLFQEAYATAFWILIAAGLVVSALSGLERRVPWIAAFCAWFGEGCRRTESFTLLRVPVFAWGLVFYGGVGLLRSLAEPLVPWAVAAGLGAELTFLWIMLRLRVFCIFCLLNGAVVLLLFGTTLEPGLFWPAAVLALLVFGVSSAILQRENREEMAASGPPTAGPPAEDIREGPALGPADAPVTVVEYSDYLCPACRKAHETVKRVREQNRKRVRWVFRDLPLERHEGAREMAEAAHCAGDQGLFWEFQDAMFRVEEAPDRDGLMERAVELGADAEAFRACLESGRHRERVERGIQEARQAGVSATPTFFVNGRMVRGAPSEEELQGMIDQSSRT